MHGSAPHKLHLLRHSGFFFHLIYMHYNVHLKMQNAEKNLYKFLSESESFIHLLLSKEKLHLKMKGLFNV